MYVTMVKKRLLSGAACKKCVEAEELLRNRGLWDRIQRVVWAVEGEPASEGMQLAQRYGVATAPFFIVADSAGEANAHEADAYGADQAQDLARDRELANVQIVESTLKLMRALNSAHVAVGTAPAASISASEASPAQPSAVVDSSDSSSSARATGVASATQAAAHATHGNGFEVGASASARVEAVAGQARLGRREAEALIARYSGTSTSTVAPESQAPQDVLRTLLSRFGAQAAIAFSGAEDVVLVHMAAHTGQPFSVFCLDTGRLHSETYHFIDKVRSHYGVDIALYSPQAEPLQAFVRKKGLFSFYEDGHAECCGVRKVEPLKRALAHASVWITGQRRDQSPDTRAGVPVLQIDEGNSDPAHEGVLLKSNPLSNWSSERVWGYIREQGVPYNALHERGFISVGCEPCTRPILPGQHEREGRWWWEQATKKECGLHR